MQLVTLDFETYYDKDYTLKKLTTEEYIRDPRFKVHCVGIKRDAGPAISNGNVNVLSKFELGNVAVLAHHAHFDGLILSHKYEYTPTFWFDTMCMARLVLPHLKKHSLEALAEFFGLPPKVVPYNKFIGQRDLTPDVQRELEEGCKHDVELTYEIFKRLLPFVPAEELRIIDLTIRMFTEPALCLDRPMMQAYYDEDVRKKQELLDSLGIQKEDLRSDKRLADLLVALGEEPPTKLSKVIDKKTGKQKVKYAFAKTDEGFKDLLAHENEKIVQLSECRLAVKSTIAESRAKRMLDMDSRGAMCVYLNTFGAHTLRWSGGDSMNWQNLTKGTPLRLALVAPPGYEIVVVDKSQIECRLLNFMAGELDVLEAFRLGRDLYADSASRFYQRPINKKDDKFERDLFKTIELGCGFGMGAEKFQKYAKQAGIIITIEQAKELIQFYRFTHPRVKALWKEADRIIEILAAGGTINWHMCEIKASRIYLPNGSFLDYQGLYQDEEGAWKYPTKKGNSKIYGSLLVENVIQALARVLLARSMIKIAQRYKVVLSTHDECAYLAKTEEAAEAFRYGVETFTSPPEWCRLCPLAAEGGWDKRYSK